MADDTKTPDKPKAKPRESTRKAFTLREAVTIDGVARNPGDTVQLRPDQAKRLHNRKII